MDLKWIETILYRWRGEVLSEQTIRMISADLQDYLTHEKPEWWENLKIPEDD